MSAQIQLTPDSVRLEMELVSRELRKASDSIYQHELAMEKAELDAQFGFDLVFTSDDEGTVEDRKAKARIATKELRKIASDARTAYNRVKTKERHLTQEQMRLMNTLKSLMAEGA